MTVGVTRENIAIVLQRPRYPENIGSAARAMCNMGFHRLIVVDPGIWDEERIRRLATPRGGSRGRRNRAIRRSARRTGALRPCGRNHGPPGRATARSQISRGTGRQTHRSFQKQPGGHRVRPGRPGADQRGSEILPPVGQHPRNGLYLAESLPGRHGDLLLPCHRHPN